MLPVAIEYLASWRRVISFETLFWVAYEDEKPAVLLVSLVLAIVPLVVLRLAGFHRERTDGTLAGSKPVPGGSPVDRPPRQTGIRFGPG